jgi:hypothetical protein
VKSSIIYNLQIVEGVIAGACYTRGGDQKYMHKIVVGTPEEKGTLGKPKCIWENNTY